MAAALFTLLAIATTAQGASATRAAHSPLLGYPRFGGVVLVHDGSRASIERERAIESAGRQEAATATRTTAGPSSTSPNCLLEKTEPGANLCWWGGPVLRAHTVHLIFWEGKVPGHEFSNEYIEAVKRYFLGVAASSGSGANVYAIGAEYGDGAGPGQYSVAFGQSRLKDVYKDETDELPAPSSTAAGACTDLAVSETAPCVTDKDVRKEVETAIKNHNEEGGAGREEWLSNEENVYFVLTPERAGGCLYGNGETPENPGESNACAYQPGGYCAYHSHFGTNAAPMAPIYTYLPYLPKVEGCDAFQYPVEAEGPPEEFDAALDVAAHEHNEMITDPFGNGWHDLIGSEIADKCLPPETFNTYGTALGGGAGSLYNQVIGGWHYFIQRLWSDTAFSAEGGEGGCEQRVVPVSFVPPSGPRASTPATFDGSVSGEAGDPITYWVWGFGDGVQSGAPTPTVTHTYNQPGRYVVSLTAYDSFGNSNTVSRALEVGPSLPDGPGSTTTTSTTSTVTMTSTSRTSPVAHFSAAQLAGLLGLASAGHRFNGLGVMTFGHASCPPACELVGSIYTKVTVMHRHRRVQRSVLIGFGKIKADQGHNAPIALRLNSQGRRLLQRTHTLASQLQLTVIDLEGGSWQLARSYSIASAR